MDLVTSFRTIVERVTHHKNKTVAVAVAEDHDVLAATVLAKQEEIADFLYIGDPERIQQIATESQVDISGIEIIEELDGVTAVKKALELIKEGTAHVLMKGKITTAQILGTVLKDTDLKAKYKDRFLSHVGIFEWDNRLKIFSDPALTIAPDIEQKRKIALNTIRVAHKLGIHRPRVAFLSAVEKVSPKMPSTVDAAELAKMEWEDAIVDGPLAFDGAMFAEAYLTKGTPSPVEGQADILICPNIEAANLFYKTLAWVAKLDIAGVMTGAGIPFIMTSRSDSARTKFLSIATNIYLAE